MNNIISNAHERRANRPHKGLDELLSNIASNGFDEEYDVSLIDSMETADDNPGTGRIIDKYLYQKGGRYLENVVEKTVLKLWPHSATSTTFVKTILQDAEDDSIAPSATSTATASNLPGPGRIIDKYFYQKAGRWVERLSVRIAISWSSVPPQRIVPCILRFGNFNNGDRGPNFYSLGPFPKNQTYVMKSITRYRQGKETLDGMKCLLKQAKSKNTPRCASALAGMLRLAAHDTIYLDFLYHRAPVEEIFRMGINMKNNDPAKQYVQLLLSLTESIMSVFNRVELSNDLVHTGYRCLLEVMNMWKFDPLRATVNACCAFVQLTACATRLWIVHTMSPDFLHFYKMIYYYVVFLVKSLCSLNIVASNTHNSRDRQYRALLISICTHWFDGLAFSVMKAIRTYSTDGGYQSAELSELELALNSAFLLHSETDSPFPRCYRVSQTHFFEIIPFCKALPRRFRTQESAWNRTGQNIHLLFRSIASNRTRAFMANDQLFGTEVLLYGSKLQVNPFRPRHAKKYPRRHHKSNASSSGEYHDVIRAKLGHALELAKGKGLNQLGCTEEFLEAIEQESLNIRFWQSSGWVRYNARCAARHSWGEYLCSDLDWDWSPARCFKWMFVEKREIV